jgi:hypothetical protein
MMIGIAGFPAKLGRHAFALTIAGLACLLGDAAAQSADLQIQAWKAVTLGSYKSVEAIRDAMDAANIHVGESAGEILARPAFHLEATTHKANLVVVSVADLGFGEEGASLAQIHKRAAQLGMAPCSEEIATLLRLQYLNQPVGEFLHVAMNPVATYGGDLVDLTLANGGAGLLLVGGDGRAEIIMPQVSRFVFVRPVEMAMRPQP